MRQEQVPATTTVDPQAGASEAGKQTDSQTEDTVYKFDLRAKYQDPDDPAKVIDGNALKTRLNLGSLARSAQSERDKARAQLQQTQQQMQQLQQQNALLQKQMAQREQEQTTLETLRKLGIKPESQDSGNAGSSWFTDEAQPLTQEQVLQQLAGIEQRTTEKVSEGLRSELAQIINESKLEEQSRQNTNAYISRVRQASEAGYRSAMPDMPERDISNMGQLMEEATASLIIGGKASEMRDDETANEAYVQAAARLDELAKLMTQGSLKQKELDEQKMVREQTEMFSPGGKAHQELQEMKSERTFNKQKSKKLRDDFLEKSRKFERDIRRIKSQ